MRDWAVITAANGRHSSLLTYSVPTLEQYADKHDMDLLVENIGDHAYPASWYKIPFMQRELAKRDGVLWIDADAMFMRFDQDIRDVALAPWNWVHSQYTTLGCDCIPNAGVVAVTKPGAEVLDALFDLRDKHAESRWWEQSAAHELFGWTGGKTGRLTRKIELQGELPGEWNSMPISASPDPIVFHASGIPFEERVRLMKEHS